MSNPNPAPYLISNYGDWDELIKHCDHLEELSDFEKEAAKRSFSFLRKHLGESFLDDALKTDNPFMGFIINIAPWTRKWVTWFADALKDLERQENYSSLLNRLKNPSNFNEALSVLAAAHDLFKNGFKITFDPKTLVSGARKMPDLRITNLETNEEFYVEVTIIGIALREKDIERTHRSIGDIFLYANPRVLFTGQVYKVLSEPHLNEVVAQVKALLDKCHRENAFQRLSLEGVIDIAFAPEADKALLDAWVKSKGLDSGFLGPPIDVNDVIRCLQRIEEEQKQLPVDRPNIVVIQNGDFFFRIGNKKKAVSELEEEVYRYRHIFGVVITGDHIGGPNVRTEMIGNHMYTVKVRADFVVTESILLVNKYCSFPISPSSLSRVQSAFR